jgi:hypothetical protein
MRTPTFVIFAVVMGYVVPAAAQDVAKIETYFGSFVGSAVTRNAGMQSYQVRNRDLNVSIAATADGGFKLTSTYVARRGFFGGGAKRSTTSLTFVTGGRPNSWRATTSRPLAEGGPTILARLNARGLHVYVATFGKDGKLNTAVYSRKISRAGGMELRYHRAVDGFTVRSVFGRLSRQKK